jgi:hypothetical protein
MNRCRECNCVMTKTESTCLGCGSEMEITTGKDKMAKSMMFIITSVLALSSTMTVASLFVDGLHFSRCAPATLVLVIVRSSAAEMLVKKKA